MEWLRHHKYLFHTQDGPLTVHKINLINIDIKDCRIVDEETGFAVDMLYKAVSGVKF